VGTQSQIDAANAAINAASSALQERQAVLAANNTPANRAAVKALTQRVESAQSTLAGLVRALPRPVSPDAPPLGVVQTLPTTPPATLTPLPPSTTFLGEVPPTATDLSGQNVPIGLGGGIVGSAASVSAAQGWDYWRGVIGGDFTEAEYLFEDIASSVLEVGTSATFVEVGAGLTADVASLEVVGFAAAMLLGEYAFGWIVTKVAQVFPNPSIFGWHPLNFIVAGINNFGKQFEDNAKYFGDHIATIFTQPIRQILGLFQRSGNATASAHNKISSVVTTHIPQARHDAVVTAGQYTDAQVNALIITENNAIAQVKADTTALIDAKVQSITTTDAAAIRSLETELVKRLQGDEQTLSSIQHTISVVVPQEIATAAAQAQAASSAQLSAATQQIEGEITALNAQINTLSARVSTDEQVIASAQSNIANLSTQEQVDQAAISTQEQIIATAQSDILSNLTSIQDLNTKITGISATLAPVKAAQQLNTNQLSTYETVGAVMLPTLLAALSSQLQKLQTKVDTCVVTTCDPTSPNNLKNQLMSLLGLMSAAGELAFIAEAVKDPLGTADSLAPTLDTIDQGAVSTLDALLSVL